MYGKFLKFFHSTVMTISNLFFSSLQSAFWLTNAIISADWKLQPQGNMDFELSGYIFATVSRFPYSFSIFLFHFLPSSLLLLSLPISCTFINYRNLRCKKLLERKLDGRREFIAAYYIRLYFFLQFPCTTPRSMLDFRVALHFVQVLSLVTAVESRTVEISFW